MTDPFKEPLKTTPDIKKHPTHRDEILFGTVPYKLDEARQMFVELANALDEVAEQMRVDARENTSPYGWKKKPN